MKEHYWNIVECLEQYVKENNLKALVLGISGGIDSTVCAVIAREVSKRLGIESIGISMPLKNSPSEVNIAKKVGQAWYKDGTFLEIPLENVYEQFQLDILHYGHEEDCLSIEPEEYSLKKGYQTKIANGNIMARIRMIYLYNWAGIKKGIVLDTDNLTEHYLGFFTIHGDQGDYKPIGGLWKMEVYELAKWMLENIARTGEEKESLQKSIDAVPTDGNGISSSDLEQIGGKSYDEVDRVLRKHIVRENISIDDIPEGVVKKILERYNSTHYKRNK